MNKKQDIKKNKVVTSIAAIESYIANNFSELTMDNDEDRVKIAWWIYQEFCSKDYRETLHAMEVSIAEKENRQVNLTDNKK